MRLDRVTRGNEGDAFATSDEGKKKKKKKARGVSFREQKEIRASRAAVVALLGEPFASSRAAHLEQAPRSAQDCAASASAPSPLGSAAMSVSSEDAARGVVGRPHAGNAAGWALAGEEKIRSSDGTQRVGGLREMGPRAWLAVAGATRPDEANRACRRDRGVGARRMCRDRRPRSMPARARLATTGGARVTKGGRCAPSRF